MSDRPQGPGADHIRLEKENERLREKLASAEERSRTATAQTKSSAGRAEAVTRARAVALGAVCVVYLASMLLPVTNRVGGGPRGFEGVDSVLERGDHKEPESWDGFHPGYEVFLYTGQWLIPFPIGLVVGGWVWLANPFLWIGWWCFIAGKQRAAVVCGAVAVLIGLATPLQFFRVCRPGFSLYAGYYAWLASMILFVIVAVWSGARSLRRSAVVEGPGGHFGICVEPGAPADRPRDDRFRVP